MSDEIAGDEETKLEVRENNAREIRDAIKRDVALALEEIGLRAEGYSKAICPVDTGRLRNSITHVIAPDENSVYIGTNVEYGPTIEFGRSDSRYAGANGGRGFLRPAAQDHSSEYAGIVRQHLSG